MIPKSGNRFSDKITRNQKCEGSKVFERRQA